MPTKQEIAIYNQNYHKHRSKDEAFKEAARIRAKLWREKNPDVARESVRKSKKKNKEKLNARQAEYYKENSERIKKYVRQWTELNIDHVRARKAEYRKRNPHVAQANNARRRAKKRMVGGSFSTEFIRNLYRLQMGKCPCCSLPLGDDYHIDHIIPIALGGDNSEKNIQLLRSKCNLQKNAKHPVEFMQSRGFLL